ncbi:hypothetical protein [Aeromonas hydrophila]|uniref:hypothetical protein n=1 Tax=Aeromonas hydrophila TaxID=644 RepID=UPI00259EBA3C|nr:hypothetical protein [Aeromonas hydrophila]MDM5119960.1 hypothetical protein [Aeromonas hydrophila]
MEYAWIPQAAICAGVLYMWWLFCKPTDICDEIDKQNSPQSVQTNPVAISSQPLNTTSMVQMPPLSPQQHAAIRAQLSKLKLQNMRSRSYCSSQTKLTPQQIEAFCGVKYDVLAQLGVVESVEDNAFIMYDKLAEQAHIIEAIRNDPTGLTAAMYGINLDEEENK